jgi:hypothetical protein
LVFYQGLEILNGSIAFANGDKYVGDFKDGQLTGNGTYYYINNDVYKGDWLAKISLKLFIMLKAL